MACRPVAGSRMAVHPPPPPAAPSGPSFTRCSLGMQTFRPPLCLDLLGCEMGTVGESVWGTGCGESRTHRAEVPRAQSLDGNAPLLPSLLEPSITRATGRCTPRRPRPCCGAARGGTSSPGTRAASPVSAHRPRPAPLLPQMPQPPVQSNGSARRGRPQGRSLGHSARQRLLA